jgi:Mrp family chromosome partitioning ATPase
MSRMLEALKRIEDRPPQRPETPPSVRAESPALAAAMDRSPRSSLWAASLDTGLDASSAVVESQFACPVPVREDRAAPGSRPSVHQDLECELLPADLAAEATLDQLEAAVALAADAPPAPPPLRQPGTPYHELARSILAQLAPRRPAVLMFTSPADGAGTTLTVVRLAAVMAEQEIGEVLAVDANFRRPGLAAHFNVQPARNLNDVLTGSVRWQDAVRPTAVPRLSVLPGAQPSASAAEDYDVGGLLRELVRHYALVLVDGASLAWPETGSIAACCEGTYLVTRLGQTNRRTLRRAARVIEQCRGRLRGCVVIEGRD